MKQYPRIYSLSTLGLIHHQEFDYLFHPFRTDFIGESGSGKSMIADLIQLIFVGSDAFESATKATGKRDPEGMVLNQGGHSKTMGYAFLNIEMQPGKYLIAGSCIETGNRNAYAFIIQQGFDKDNIGYLETPLSFKDFLLDDDIQPIDRLKDMLSEKGLFCQSWTRLKKYHETLYKENILPLDLAASERQLKDYAEILQSFSRGKMLDTQKSNSLKYFLFGTQVAKEIHESYQAAVKDMEAAVGEYGTNLKEIERVTQKQKALQDLKQIKDGRDLAQKAWAEKNILFYNQQVETLKKEIVDLVNEYAIAKQHYEILQTLLGDEIKKMEGSIPELQMTKQNAQNKYEDILSEYKKIENVETWIKKINCTFPELKLKFEENKQILSQLDFLKELNQLLKAKKVEKEFEQIKEKESLSTINNFLATSINTTQSSINRKESLKKFADVTNQDSLAYWAIQQKRLFTLEEESVLLCFQDLPRHKPLNNTDYLPSPSELFTALEIAEKEEKGFWINLQGMRRYIKYATDQVFNTTDEKKIQSYFSDYTNDLDKDIKALKDNLAAYNSLQEVFTLLKNPADSLLAYNQKEIILKYQLIPSLNISKEMFEENLEVYKNKNDIQSQYEERKNLSEIANENLAAANNAIAAYKRLEATKGPSVDNSILSLLNTTQYASLIVEVDVNLNLVKENVRKEFERSDNKEKFVQESNQLIFPKIKNIQGLAEKNQAYQSNSENFDKAKITYQKLYGIADVPIISEKHVSDPSKEYEIMIRAEELFNATYKTIINQYIPQESYKLEDEEDFGELAKSLLPEAFHDAILADQTESGIIESIATYLHRINDKNRQLNNRKIQKIKDLLHEVDVAASEQENIIRRIDNFLKTETNITGGYKARLKKTSSPLYPKEWMTKFREDLEDNVNNLAVKVAEKIDLENMMTTAFLNCGGHQSTQISVHKLLDPSVYYEIEFKMESETGRINKGSTGQTYAAIALLCIARLSVIEKEEGRKMQPAVRVMPIDEAEGLGSNYDMLHDIAKAYDYQLISLSIGPVGKFKDGEQYLYMLHKNEEVEEPINYTPMAILCETDKVQNEVGV